MDVISYALSKKYTDEKCKEMDNMFQDYKNQSMLKTIGIEKELNDFKNTLHQVNVNQEAKQSTSGYGIVDLPKNAANGQVGVSVKGETRTNLFDKNNIKKYTNQTIQTIDGVRCVKLHRPNIDNTYFKIENGFEENTQYTLKSIVKGEKGRWVIRYTDGTSDTHLFTAEWEEKIIITSENKTVERISYTNGENENYFSYIEIDNLQIEKGTELKSYISGTKSTLGAMKVKSVGKNLFDGKAEQGTISKVTGKPASSSTYWRTVNFIKVKPNTLYRFKYYNSNRGFTYYLYDADKNLIKSTSWGAIESWFVTTTENTVFMKLVFEQINEQEIKVVVTDRDLPTEYEPYKESTAYVVAKDKDNKIVNLRSLPNGVRDEIRVSEGKLIKSISNDIPVFDIMYESIDTTTYTNVDIIKTTAFTDAKVGTVEVDGQTRYYDKNGVELTEIAQADIDLTISAGKYYWDIDGTLCIIVEKGTYTDITAARTGLGVTSINYELAEPEIIPIQVSGNIVSNPSGTIYIEQAVADANVYNNGITIFEQELNIDYIDKLSKVDYKTGVETEIDASKCIISEDKKSFTHPDLQNGDMVFFEYYYSNETTQGEATVEYYDSRYVIPDKTLPDKYYKWNIEVDNGVPNVIVTEV